MRTCFSHRMTNYLIKWVWLKSRDSILKFDIRSVAFERMKLCNPNFVCERSISCSLTMDGKNYL